MKSRVALTRFLTACTAPLRVWNDPTYGVIELRSVTAACAAE